MSDQPSALSKKKIHFEGESIQSAKGRLKKNSIKNNKKKEETTMKNNNKKTIIITIVSTVAVLAVLIATFIAGMNFEKDHQATVERNAKALIEKMQPAKQVKADAPLKAEK